VCIKYSIGPKPRTELRSPSFDADKIVIRPCPLGGGGGGSN